MLDYDLQILSVPLLAERCRQETERYRKKQASDEQFCLELFRRALNLSSRSDGADVWDALVRQYDGYIRACFQRTAFSALNIVDTDEIVQLVWIRFWEASRRNLTFDHISKALNYLKLIVTSEIVDAIRKGKRGVHDISLDMQAMRGQEPTLPREQSPQHVVEQQRFDARCLEMITNTQDREIFILSRMGYKPADIAQVLQKRGQHINNREPTSRRVSDALERIFERLQGDEELIVLLEAG